MKSLLTCLLLWLVLTASAQNYTNYYISYEYLEVIEYSVKITYTSSGEYQASNDIFSFYGNALAQRQAKYDFNRDQVSIAYGQLENLKLINSANKSKLNDYRATIIPEIKAKAGSVDFSYDRNAEMWINYISQPFSNPTIKAEIELLQNIRSRLLRLKRQYPSSYQTTAEYKQISAVLTTLSNCSASDIKYINKTTGKIERSNIELSQQRVNTAPRTPTSTKKTMTVKFQSLDGSKFKIVNTFDNSVVCYVNPESPTILREEVNSNQTFLLAVYRITSIGIPFYFLSLDIRASVDVTEVYLTKRSSRITTVINYKN